jgi:hypothetical protein
MMVQTGYTISALADPEIPPETIDRINLLGELAKDYEILLEREKDCRGSVSLEEWQNMAKQYKDAGMDWLPRPLAARVGEGSYRTILSYQQLPGNIDELAMQIIRERGNIKPDHLAGLLKVTSSTVGRIIGRLKDKNLICMDRKGKRLILIKENIDEKPATD